MPPLPLAVICPPSVNAVPEAVKLSFSKLTAPLTVSGMPNSSSGRLAAVTEPSMLPFFSVTAPLILPRPRVPRRSAATVPTKTAFCKRKLALAVPGVPLYSSAISPLSKPRFALPVPSTLHSSSGTLNGVTTLSQVAPTAPRQP